MKNDYLLVAKKAAARAGEIIMKHYPENIEIDLKSDRSPVTIADTEAEKSIIEIIKNDFPDHGIIGEELGNHNIESPFKWIIDPLDGTKLFYRNMPFFATQIALMKDGDIIMGLSKAPALKEMAYAEKGRGAFLNGKKISVSKTDKLSSSYLFYGGLKLFRKNKKVEGLLNIADKTFWSRGSSDFWSYHLLSSGKIDIMVEAETKIWDIAAFSVIVEEAGGKVTDINGEKITLSSNSIIATNNILHEETLKYFSN